MTLTWGIKSSISTPFIDFEKPIDATEYVHVLMQANNYR